MAYNFGLRNVIAAMKAPFWNKFQIGQNQTFNGVSKPAIDNAFDNNYHFYSDNAAGTAAVPTFNPCSALMHFVAETGVFEVVGEERALPVTPPAAPTAVVNGTVGSTGYTYSVVARAGSQQVPAASTVAVTTGNATLTGLNSITITWVPVIGANFYDIYRTVSAGTPSTTGLIGSVLGGIATFTDTGITADGSTVPSANTTGAFSGGLTVLGNLTLIALATPAAPLVTPQGTVGVTSYSYKIVARSGNALTPSGNTAASAAGSTTTGNATLSASNFNQLVWQPVPGAVSYDIYRTVGGAAQGKIANVHDVNTLNDTGLTGDTTTAPTTNNTGQAAGGIGQPTTTPWTFNYAGNAVPATLTTGTDTFGINGQVWISAVFIPANALLTGINFLIGTVGGTDKAIVLLFNAAGVVVANSALAGVTVGVTATMQAIPFTAAYNAVGPGLYFIGVQTNGGTAKIRTQAAGVVPASVATQVFGTPAAITPPTTFTAANGPFASTY